jgi:FkbM family methyltransferase
LLGQVRPGDVVWDVGANVGLYTLPLSEAVGASGKVFAFEPTPTCFAALNERTQGRANIQAVQTALGDRVGTAQLAVDSSETSTTNSLFVAGATKTLDVRITTGDSLVASAEVLAPDVLKVDVEGFEEEVLRGLTRQLARPRCRAVFCEVHFGILDARGERHAPSRIVELLREHGFRTRWLDPSHLSALRARESGAS